MINYDYKKYENFLNIKDELSTINNIIFYYNKYNIIKEEIIKNYYLKIINNILHYNIEKDINNDKKLIKLFDNEYKNNNLFINKFYNDNYDYKNFYEKINIIEIKNNNNFLLKLLLPNNNSFIKNEYNYTNIYYLNYKNKLNETDFTNFLNLLSFKFNDTITEFYKNNETEFYFKEGETFYNKLIIHSICFGKDIIYNNIFDSIYNDNMKFFYIFTKYYSKKNNINYNIYDIYYENNLILYVSLNYINELIIDNKYIDFDNNNNNFLNELKKFSDYNNIVDKINTIYKKKHEYLCYVHLYINNILNENKNKIIKINMIFINFYINKYNLKYSIINEEIYDKNKKVFIPYICKYNYFIFLLHVYIFNKKNELEHDNFLHLYYKYYDELLLKTGSYNDYLNNYFPSNYEDVDYKLKKFNVLRCKITFLNCMYYYTLYNTDIHNYINNKYDIIQIYKNITEIHNQQTISYVYNIFENNIERININFVKKDFFNDNLYKLFNIYISDFNKNEKKKLLSELDILNKENLELTNTYNIYKNKYLEKFNNFINKIEDFKETINKVVNLYISFIKSYITKILEKLNCNTQSDINNYKNSFDDELNEDIINDNNLNKLFITNYKQFINCFYNIFLYFYCFFEIIINNYEIIKKINNNNNISNDHLLNDHLLNNINIINTQLLFIKKVDEKNYLNLYNYNNYNIYLNEFFFYTYSENNFYLRNLKVEINEIKLNLFTKLDMIKNNNDNFLKNKLIFLYNISNCNLIEIKLQNVKYKIDQFINYYNNNLELYNKNHKDKLNNILFLIKQKNDNNDKFKLNCDNLNNYNDKIIYFNKLYNDNNNLQNYYNYMFFINQNEFKLYKKIKNNKKILYYITKNIINKDLFYKDYLNKYLENLLIDILYDNKITINFFTEIYNKIKNIKDYIIQFLSFLSE